MKRPCKYHLSLILAMLASVAFALLTIKFFHERIFHLMNGQSEITQASIYQFIGCGSFALAFNTIKRVRRRIIRRREFKQFLKQQMN
jgi:hypothetical protein